jgi:hypothetical protein
MAIIAKADVRFLILYYFLQAFHNKIRQVIIDLIVFLNIFANILICI